MQISYDDILFSAEMMFDELINITIAEETHNTKHLSENDFRKIVEKYSTQNILSTTQAKTMVTAVAVAAIENYHEQLREKLLEFGIDIDEIDTKSKKIRKGYKELFEISDDE